MSYALGVDLGTSFTAAAVWHDGRAEMVELGEHRATTPSAVFLDDGFQAVTGDAAIRRGAVQPDRLAIEFKRRLGDTTPLLVGGAPLAADALMTRLLAGVLARVTEVQGSPPSSVVLTHPANWGPYKTDLLAGAARQAGVSAPVLVSEPVAAATHYAAQQRIAIGSTVLVYDLGGGTFDVSVLRKDEDGFRIIGRPDGVERLGGIDVDEAVLGHVVRHVPELMQLDADDAEVLAALHRLRAECRAAKEALSSDTDATVDVRLPGIERHVRLTRAELARMIGPILADTIAATRRALDQAGLGVDEMDRLVLAGGSSRIPAVAEAISTELGIATSIDVHPKHVVALGAARIAGTLVDADQAAPLGGSPPAGGATSAEPSLLAIAVEASDRPASAAGSTFVPSPRSAASPLRQRRRLVASAAAVIGAVVVVGGAVALFRPTDDRPADASALATNAAAPQPAAPQPEVSPPGAPDTVPPTTGVDDPDPATTQPDDRTVPAACRTLAALDRFGCITGFSISNVTVLVDYLGGEDASVGADHVHFFTDVTPPAEAGAPAPVTWREWDREATFAAPADDPFWTGATRLCVLAATIDHIVVPDSGNCVDLPGRVLAAIAGATP